MTKQVNYLSTSLRKTRNVISEYRTSTDSFKRVP